jgi:hypothetical protein
MLPQSLMSLCHTGRETLILPLSKYEKNRDRAVPTAPRIAREHRNPGKGLAFPSTRINTKAFWAGPLAEKPQAFCTPSGATATASDSDFCTASKGDEGPGPVNFHALEWTRSIADYSETDYWQQTPNQEGAQCLEPGCPLKRPSARTSCPLTHKSPRFSAIGSTIQYSATPYGADCQFCDSIIGRPAGGENLHHKVRCANDVLGADDAQPRL